jgi:hypothetical protein
LVESLRIPTTRFRLGLGIGENARLLEKSREKFEFKSERGDFDRTNLRTRGSLKNRRS